MHAMDAAVSPHPFLSSDIMHAYLQARRADASHDPMGYAFHLHASGPAGQSLTTIERLRHILTLLFPAISLSASSGSLISTEAY